MKIGDVVGSLAGLPVGTWARDARGRLWCVLTREIHKERAGPSGVDYIPGSNGADFGPFTICRPPVGAVLPSVRYAPEGTWLRDWEGYTVAVIATKADDPGEPWYCIPLDGHETLADRFAPFTVIADPREASESDDVAHDDADMECLFHVAMDDAVACDDRISAAKEWLRRFQPARLDAGAMHSTLPVAYADSAPSPVARMLANTYRTPSGWLCVPHDPARMTERTPESINPRRMTWGDTEGAMLYRVAPKPEPMPRVDLITTGGDQSWRKARPVNRRPGRVDPVCGWSSYYD